MFNFKNMILLWILTIYLAQSSAVRDNLERNPKFTAKIFMLNGELISLKDLYGSGTLTEHSSRVINTLISTAPRMEVISRTSVERVIGCANGQCVNRDLEALPSESGSESSQEHIPLKKLASKLIETSPSSSTNPRVTFIMGEKREGKTVALKKITHEIVSEYSSRWTVYIDLEALKKILSANRQNLNTVVRRLIPEKFQPLFLDLLDVNPKQIMVLIDYSDKLIDVHLVLKSMAEEFMEKGVQVIATGDYYTSNYLSKQGLDLDVYKLSDMTYSNTKEFLQNFIIEDFAELLHVPIQSVIYNAKEIVPIATTMLMRTSLPRQPEIFQQLMAYWAFDDNSYLRKFMENKEKGPESIDPIRMLRKMTLNKKNIYGCIVKMLNNGDPDFDYMDEYGAVGLDQSIRTIVKGNFATNILRPFNSDIEEAMIKLKSGDIEARFTNIIDGKITFIYPDLMDFFAADFLAYQLETFMTDFSKSHSAEFASDFLPSKSETYQIKYFKLKNMLQIIFSDGDYSRIMEYFNFDERMYDKIFLKDIIMTSGVALQASILDNMLSQGHGEILQEILNVYLENNKGDYLKKYFTQPGTKALYHQHMVMERVFKIIETDQTSYKYINKADHELPSRMDLLAVHNLPYIYTKLISEGIIAPNKQQKLKLMAEALTNPFPDSKLLKMIEASDSALLVNPVQMLHQAISNSGELSKDALSYLIEKFDNSLTTTEQRELLHQVLQWNNPELLDTVMEGLGISLTAEIVDETTLAVALDSNPSPLYTPTDFWRKMHTFLSRSSVKFDLSSWMQDSEPMSISWTDARSEWLRVMLGAESIGEASIDAAQIEFTPIDPSDSRFDQYLGRVKTIPATQWGLRAETLALRRKLLVQKLLNNWWDGSLTELLVHYRSSLPLTFYDHLFFRKTIHLAIQHDGTKLTEAHKIRILDTLRDNIGDVEDLADIKSIFEERLLTDQTGQLHSQYENLIPSRVSICDDPNQPSTSSTLTVGERLVQTRIQFDRSLQNQDEFVRRQNLLSLPQNNRQAQQDVLGCIRRGLGKRSIGKSACDNLWEDLDEISETKERKINNIRINSDKFLEKLSINEPKSIENTNRLLTAVNELIKREENYKKITGNMKNLMKDVIKYHSFTEYRKYQRMKSSIIKISRSVASKIRLPSASVMIHGALALPLIQDFAKTISACSKNISSHACVSSALSFGASLSIAGMMYATRYIPYLIPRLTATAVHMLPKSLAFLETNIRLAGSASMEVVTRYLGPSLAVVSGGMEIAQLVGSVQDMQYCSNNPDACTKHRRTTNMINAVFACASLPGLVLSVVPGAQIIGAALLAGLAVLKFLASGVAELIEITRQVDLDFWEKTKVFFHGSVGTLPSDVQHFLTQSEWAATIVNMTQNALEQCDEHTVAYGMGLGSIPYGSTVYSSSYSEIDMSHESEENNYGLTRVSVKVRDNMVALCIPKRDGTQDYEKYPQNVKNANFSCKNALVIGQKERWKKAKTGQSTVLFNLQYVKKGRIIGSKNLNNLFLIYQSDHDLEIVGSSGNATKDVYSIKSNFFTGKILMNSHAKHNLLDLSSINTTNLTFSWYPNDNMSWIMYDMNNTFRVKMKNGPVKFNLRGRENMQDNFTCNWCQNSRCITHNDEDISVDTGGGHSIKKMDYIIDCKMSVINPFSVMIGSDTPDAIYTSYLTLEGASAREEVDLSHVQPVKIQPRKSHYSLHFSNYPLLKSTIVVTYSPTSKTLSWILQQNVSTQMQISVEPYLVTSPVSDPAEEAENTPSCTFMDYYINAAVTPVIKIPANETAPFNVTQFHVIGSVNSSRLTDVLAYFADINVYSGKFTVVTRLVDTQTNKTFMMGSRADDSFYIDSTVVFLSGSSGHDVYSWSQQSPRHVWIENSADDDALDTIVISDQMCDFLTANWSSVKSDCCGTFDNDVTLICEHKTRVNSTQRIILQRYMEAVQYRHLIIHWKNTLYVIIPPAWLSTSEKEAKSIKLGVLFSLSDHRDQSVRIRLTSDDRYLVLNETETTNPLIAFRYPNSLGHFNDVVIAQKIYQRGSSSVLLKNFLDDTGDISIEWFNFYIIVVNDWLSNNTKPTILTAMDIQSLCSNSTINPDNLQAPDNSVSVKYYNINSEDRKIIPINHTTTGANNTVQLGIILVSDISPINMSVSATRNKLKLKIMAKEVSIGNWCSDKQNRLYGIEFRIDLLREPVIIDNLQQLECNFSDTKHPLRNVVTELRVKLKDAQKRYKLSLVDTDELRLMKCVGSIMSVFFSHDPTYKLFGFLDYNDQIIFTHDNCPQLIAQTLKNTGFKPMKTLLKKTIKWSKFDEVTDEDRMKFDDFYRQFTSIKNCWSNLKQVFIDQFNSTIVFNNTSLTAIEKSISPCKK